MVVKKVSYSIPPDSMALKGGTTTVTCSYGYVPSVREKYSMAAMVQCSASRAEPSYSRGASTLTCTGGSFASPSSVSNWSQAAKAKSCTSSCLMR
jgi:hypothetical protein